MVIEIGTSDFRTQAGQVDGVFIEPVKYYFDKMVDLSSQRMKDAVNAVDKVTDKAKSLVNNTHRENVAISDYEGEVEVFSVKVDNMLSMGAPQWMRGCNSISKPHPSVITWCQARFIDPIQYTNRETVPVVRIKSIIDKYNITELDLLKIDTEGHDCIILNDYINTVEILPKVIQFEANVLSDPKEVAKLVARLKPLGYECKQVKDDMICRLQ